MIPLTQALIDIPSVSGTEAAVLHYTISWLKSQNFSVRHFPLPPLHAGGPPRLNVLALRQGASIPDIRVLLFTHLDVVPGTGLGPPKQAHVHGRGAVDAKAQAAGMMLAARAMDDMRVAVLLVCGEESDHRGVLHASELDFRRDVILINGEPTQSRLARTQKGMQKFVLHAQGKSGHSGYPEYGENAVDKLLDALASLHAQKLGGEGEDRTTMNIGVIRGGIAVNVIPDEAEAEVMFRIAGDPEKVVTAVKQACERANVSVKVENGNRGVSFFVPRGAGERLGTVSVSYNTDVAYWKGEYSRAVLFGAGSIHEAHTDDEYVSVEELEMLPERLASIVKEVLQEESWRV